MFLDVLDNDGSGEIDFKEFVEGMSKFSSKAEKEEKLRFAFRIYDIDNDGYISNGELYQVILAWTFIQTFITDFIQGPEDDGWLKPEEHAAAASCGQDDEVCRL